MKNIFDTAVYERFIAVNDIKKKDLAAYLDTSGAFVTQLFQGQRDIPAEKLALIKQNEDWDTSMFCEGEMLRIGKKVENNSTNSSGINQQAGGSIENSPINATSGDFIELLKKKDEQIDRLLTLLEKK